jgi:lipopolysaccharide heptosyltransferase II
MVLGSPALEDKTVSDLAQKIRLINHGFSSFYNNMNPIHTEEIQNLLIRSTNWIGDAVMTTPAVRAIRKRFPNTHISILAKPWVVPVFENSEHIDRLLIYDDQGRHKGIFGKFRLAKDLKKYHFDAVILFQNAFEAALITFLAGIPLRIGYNTDVRQLLLTHAVSCTNEIKKKHQTDYYLNIIRGIGMEEYNRELYLKLNQKDRFRVEKILTEQRLSVDDKLIGINPGATYGPAKQWPYDRFARLADKIQAFTGGRIVIFGGPHDKELGRKISRRMLNRPIDLSGGTSLGEAMALIERCDLFITNDSGLMHVAAALDVPLIAVFGSTNPATTGPLGSNSKVVQAAVPCSPCLKSDCPEGHLKCMDQIDADRVFDVAKEML